MAIDAAAIAGGALWALALYWGFSPIANRLLDQLNHWLSQAELPFRSTGSEPAPEPSHAKGDDLLTAVASLLSLVPFLVCGGLANYGLGFSLGGSWAISTGLIACMGCGIYELGRQDSSTSE